VLAAFGANIAVQNETHGFRRHQDCGLDGFVDGTENPAGADEIRSVGLNEHGGNYVLIQRYRHDLAKWNAYTTAQQEESIARSKVSNEEFPDEQRHPRAHLARVNLEKNGEEIEIVRRSLPYGNASGEHELLFIAYAGKLHNIETQLQHMFGDSADGLTDLLLERLSTAISGAYYYAPILERLRDL
jgi:Dyp-type peroxidase family protein